LLVDQVTGRPVKVLPLASSSAAVNCCVAPVKMLAVLGVTATEATGAITVTVALPVIPSLVAAMVAVPAATAVTMPEGLFTVATAMLLVDHVTERPVKVLPLPSRSVAVNCCVAAGKMLAVLGVTATEATGAITVTVALPVIPSLVAAMVAVPAATAVTMPEGLFTVATAMLLVDHVTARPVKGLPLASCSVAVNCCVAPGKMLAVLGVTVTVATGGAVTVKVACPCFPPALARIWVWPTLNAVMPPLTLTLATAGVPDDQVIVPTAIAAPFWSTPDALAVALCPTGMLDGERATVTVVSTGTAGVVGEPHAKVPRQHAARARTAADAKPM
jgi:hypothetical protein